MNKPLGLFMCIFVLLGASAARAAVDVAAAEDVAKKYKCSKCHKPDARPNPKKDGIPRKEIAEKYANDPKAMDMLIKKVKTAGLKSGDEKGHEHPELEGAPTDAEIKLVIEWYYTFK